MSNTPTSSRTKDDDTVDIDDAKTDGEDLATLLDRDESYGEIDRV